MGVYAGVSSWKAFEPALTRAEQADIIDLWRCAEKIPPEWYGYQHADLEQMVEALHQRRLLMIRDPITAFRQSRRNPFPNWGEQHPARRN